MSDYDKMVKNWKFYEAMLGLDYSDTTEEDFDFMRKTIDEISQMVQTRAMSTKEKDQAELGRYQKYLNMKSRISSVIDKAAAVGVDVANVTDKAKGQIWNMLSEGNLRDGSRFEQLLVQAQRLVDLPMTTRGESNLKVNYEGGKNSWGMTPEEREARDGKILADYDEMKSKGRMTESAIFLNLGTKY
jgi:hypothetical protein